VTGDSKQPSREAAQTGCISDIPRLKHALEQIEGMASFKAALPFLKPFMRLLKIETHGIDASLQNIEQLRADIEELRQLPDAFNDLLAERGWIIYDSLSIDVAKEAVRIARTGDLAAAEAHLVAHFSDSEIRRQLQRFHAVKAFRSRMRLARLAVEDHAAGRFHASIPVVLALMDGLVSEISENQRGFFAEGVDLRAWDSIAAHDKGLNVLTRIFQKTRRKTTTDEITLPFRHGIMHGRDLGYDNTLVAIKVWAALFAIRDWAVLAEGGRLTAPEPEPSPGLMETLRKWNDLQEQRKLLDAWRPRVIEVGSSVPASGSPDDYPEDTPERRVVSLLCAWQRNNYGHMARDAAWKNSGAPSPADVRIAFQGKHLRSFELVAVEDQAFAVSLVTVKRHVVEHESARDDTATYRVVRIDPEGSPAIGGVEAGWTIVNWNW
jgi:hypothetical protein